MAHIERKTELKRRRARREKIRKLRAKIARAKSQHEADQIAQRIKRISPFWQPPPKEPKTKREK
jgi:hypothetical protein